MMADAIVAPTDFEGLCVHKGFADLLLPVKNPGLLGTK